MRFKFENSVFFYQVLVALVLVLLAGHSADAQCSANQTHKLLPDDGAAGDEFGRSVAVSGTTAIADAGRDDDNGEDSGSAYLFDTTTGQQMHKLLALDGAAGDQFGWRSVAISGGTAIVGAFRDDDKGFNSGSAYLFDATTGGQIHKLLPSDGAAGDLFGASVGISGNTAIVGAPLDDDNGAWSGSAYLFDTTTGMQMHKLLPDDGAADDLFGGGVGGVAINGTTAIVGAFQDDDNGDHSGSAYLFDTNTGMQTHKLLPDDGATEDHFGQFVAISGNIAIVGALWDDDNGDDSGSAYLFDTTTGLQLHKLLPDDGEAHDRFGQSVAISGNIAIVGANWDDDNGDKSGSAYLFDTMTGGQIAKILPDDGATEDHFGNSVAISGTTAIVGALGDDDNGAWSGSAYVFDASDISCTHVVNADQFNVFRGFHIAGELSDTFDSDDSYLKFNPGLTNNSAEPPVWIEFEGTLPSDSPTSLSITLEANASTVGLTQTIEMFNWNTAQYEQVDAQAASQNNDSVVIVDLTANISNYVQSGTGAVKTRTGWSAPGPVLHFPWTICIDQVVWTVTQ